MKNYHHILVATDFSEDSQIITQKAKAVAQENNAKLSLVHVLGYSPMLYGAGEFSVPLSGEIEDSLQKQAQDALAKEGAKLGIAAEDQWLEMGDTADGLVSLVDKLKIDLLVLGSHEHHGLGFLLGSTSNAILHAMPCDVLAVRVT